MNPKLLLNLRAPTGGNAARFYFILLLFLCLGAGNMLFAQSSSQGVVRGRVFNAETDRYVSSALVAVEGTSIQTFTNQFGEYEIYNAPAGPQSVRVTYTGFPDRFETVVVQPGETVRQDFRLGGRARRTVEDGEQQVYELEEFVVGANDMQSFSELAIQEERYSVNLKHVVATDAYGTVAQGNVGEFVKFIPGVIVDYGGTYTSGADANSISIRGFRPDQTAVTIDGIPVSNAQPGSLTRAVGLDMLSINNASRVEVIKVPTPDQPQASIGGTVNLITKNAFEYPKPTFSFRVYLGLNSENTSIFKKTPGPLNKKTYKALPGIDLTYALPLNEKLGFSFSLASANQFNENHKAKMDYQVAERREFPKFINKDGTVIEPVYADIAHPYLNNFGITDGPRVSHRHSASVKVDYRPWDGHLFTGSWQVSMFESADAQRRYELNAGGSNGILAYGPDYLESRPGTGKAEQNVTALDTEGTSHTGYVKWEYIKGAWYVRAHFSHSFSESDLISAKNGHFSEVQLNMGGIDKAIFSDIKDGIPGDIVYYDEDGNELDENILSNYRVSGYDVDDPQASRLRVLAGETFSRSENSTGKFDIKRELDFLPLDRFMQLAFKTGMYWEERLEKKWGRGTGYGFQYIGASGVTLNVDDFLDTGYRNVSPGFGFPPREWPDAYKLYTYYKENPQGFSDTSDEPVFESNPTSGELSLVEASVAAENWNSYVNTQKEVTETKYSYYWQVESEFFNNRLSVVGGMRQDWSERRGRSPFRDHDWRFLREARDIEEDGTVGYPIMRLDDVPIWDLTQPMRAEYAEAYEAAGAIYPDGRPFRADDGEDFIVQPPRGAPIHYKGTRVGPGERDFVGYVVPGSLYSRQLEMIPNYEVDEETKGKPSPIVSSAFDLTDKIVLRVSWSRTFASADYEGDYGVLRRVEFDQDQSGVGGTIKTNNPALDPWTSDNWDFGVSYYTDSGGQFSLSYFYKSIVDFHIVQSFTPSDPDYLKELAEVGIGPESIYVRDGWTVEKPVNGDGTATTYGYEAEVRHDLSFLGDWGKTLYVYASYSTKRKSGNQNETNQIGQTADDFAAGGLQWGWKRYSARVNATWRNQNIRRSGTWIKWPDPSVGDPTPDDQTDNEQFEVGWYEYEPAELKVDVNFAIRLWKNYQLDFSARNITNTARELKRKSVDGSYPSWAGTRERAEFGVNFTVGLSGTF